MFLTFQVGTNSNNPLAEKNFVPGIPHCRVENWILCLAECRKCTWRQAHSLNPDKVSFPLLYLNNFQVLPPFHCNHGNFAYLYCEWAKNEPLSKKWFSTQNPNLQLTFAIFKWRTRSIYGYAFVNSCVIITLKGCRPKVSLTVWRCRIHFMGAASTYLSLFRYWPLRRLSFLYITLISV